MCVPTTLGNLCLNRLRRIGTSVGSVAIWTQIVSPVHQLPRSRTASKARSLSGIAPPRTRRTCCRARSNSYIHEPRLVTRTAMHLFWPIHLEHRSRFLGVAICVQIAIVSEQRSRPHEGDLDTNFQAWLARHSLRLIVPPMSKTGTLQPKAAPQQSSRRQSNF